MSTSTTFNDKLHITNLNDLISSDDWIQKCLYTIRPLLSPLSSDEELMPEVVSKMDSSKKIQLSFQLATLFIKNNFLGPQSNHDEILQLLAISSESFEKLNKKCFARLSIDGEDIRCITKYEAFLILALELSKSLENSFMKSFLLLLLHNIWCHLYTSPLSYLKEICFSFAKEITNHLLKIQPSNEVYLSALFVCLQTYIYFRKFKECRTLIDLLSRLLEIKVQLTGILGKRTKYQTFDLPQLALDVKSNSKAIGENDTEHPSSLAENIPLNDDTLLPSVSYSADIPSICLNHLQQSLLIHICLYNLKHSISGDFLCEELMPFIDVILKGPKSYSISRQCLYLRSLIENHSSRKKERSIMQLEALIDDFSVNKDDLRLESWATVFPLSFWGPKELLAKLFIEIGCLNSAIEHLIQIKSFDQLLSCYFSLGQHEKAEIMIRDEMNIHGKTPHLLCLLGQSLDNPAYYEQAWELSNGKCFRSQSELGYYYLKRKNYEKCVKHFEAALQINTIQPKICYNLGCAYLELGKTEDSANSFRFCCNLSPDNFKSWVNLSSILLHNKKYLAAHSAIMSAISCHYDFDQSWRMLAEVAMALTRPFDMLRALQRLCDIKPEAINHTMLEFMVNYIKTSANQNVSDIRLKFEAFIDLFISKTTLNHRMWWALSKLYDISISEIPKKNDFLNRALREFIFHDQKIHFNPTIIPDIAEISSELVSNLLFLNSSDQSEDFTSLYNSEFLNITNILTRLEKHLEETTNSKAIEVINKAISTLKDQKLLLNSII